MANLAAHIVMTQDEGVLLDPRLVPDLSTELVQMMLGGAGPTRTRPTVPPRQPPRTPPGSAGPECRRGGGRGHHRGERGAAGARKVITERGRSIVMART